MNTYILSPVTVAPFLVISPLCVHLSAKHIEAVAHMEHGIGVDAIVASVASAGCTHISLIITLFPQEVIKVECHNERFASKVFDSCPFQISSFVFIDGSL